MNKKEKNDFIDVLNNMLEENKNFYLADIAGLTAEESSSLRRLCYKQNVTIQVVKNTLLKKAFDYCEKNKFRLTEPRIQVLKIIANSKKPLGAYEILEELSMQTNRIQSSS